MGKEPSASACGDVSCQGCGICWAYLAIPSLRLKAKDLVSTPHLVAFALQADGWYLRSAIVWAKPNPMPESVRDRPTSAYEMVFLLAKQARYFYDAEAIAEDAENFGRQHTTGVQPPKVRALQESGHHGKGGDLSVNYERERRNARNVWTIATQPFSGAHFATMPPDLAERCIRAGTSERGQCQHCGAPWQRQTEVERFKDPTRHTGRAKVGCTDRMDGDMPRMLATVTTTGWSPSCDCPEHAPVPQMVLDPFGGAGTTALVADRLGRHATICELNPEYAQIARERLTADAPLLAVVA